MARAVEGEGGGGGVMRLLTVPEFCQLLRINAKTESRWRKDGVIPKELYFSKQWKRRTTVRYIEERVEGWIRSDSQVKTRSTARMSNGSKVAIQRIAQRQASESQSESDNTHGIEHPVCVSEQQA